MTRPNGPRSSGMTWRQMPDSARRAAIVEAIAKCGTERSGRRTGWTWASRVAIETKCSVASATQYMRTLTAEGVLESDPPLYITKMGSTQRQFRIAEQGAGDTEAEAEAEE